MKQSHWGVSTTQAVLANRGQGCGIIWVGYDIYLQICLPTNLAERIFFDL